MLVMVGGLQRRVWLNWSSAKISKNHPVMLVWLCQVELSLVCWGRDQRESRKNLDLDNFGLISSNLGLDNHENCSLGRVSISTILKSESRPDLDLDNLGNISLVPISILTIF